MATITKIEKVREDDYLATSLACPDCGESLTTPITGTQLYGYNQRMGIESVFPNLTSPERERFISGYCGDCWAKMFGDDE